MVAHLTFSPLKGNWYRVNGTGLQKSPRIKKGQIKGFMRQFYGSIRSAAHAKKPKLPRVTKISGWIECPECNHPMRVYRVGERECGNCHTRFEVV